MLGLRLDEKGRLETVTWGAEDWSMEARERAVGGPVEPLAVCDSVTMWMHAEGAYLHPINNPASRLMRLHDRDAVPTPVFGPVVLTGNRGDEVASLRLCESAWLGAWLDGRCTSVEQIDGRVVACGAQAGHPGTSHETILGGSRLIWHRAPARTFADLDEGVAS